ncbi:MAG: hypothetical protein P8H03_02120 [Emcibacteraceae bacterium]|nr:hypothetical protein [Emcibacteraceae bacterium]
MIIGRMIGYISLCLMITVSGAELLRFLEGSHDHWISLYEIIHFSWNGEIESVNDGSVIGDLTFSILRIPALFSLLFIGLLLPFMFRKAY